MRLLATVLILLGSASVHAGEMVCDPYNEASCIQSVHEGEAVPFSGHLMTPTRSKTVAESLENCREWTGHDSPSDGADETCLDQQTIWRILLESERYDRKQAEEMLMRRLSEAEKAPEWYETPWIVGVASAAAATIFVLIVR